MVAEAISGSLMETSAALVDITDPIGLARLLSETGSAPLSTRLLLKIAKTGNDLVRRADGTINRCLANLIELKMPANEVPDRRGISTKDVVIDTQTGLWVRIFLPPAKLSQETTRMARVVNGAANTEEGKGRKRRVIFYFHGGGFAVLSADMILYDRFCRRLCRQSESVIISVNYRRAPEHRYPVAYDDCYAALGWLEGFSGDLFKPHELDLSRCVLMGDSAGANIVHHVGCRWAARDERLPASTSNSSPSTPWPSNQLKIVAHVLLFPFFGGKERTPSELRLNASKAPLVTVKNMDWHWRAFLPPNSNRDHPASNVLGPNAPDVSLLPLPPSLITIGEFDMLKDRQLRYAQGLARASKPVRLLYYVGGAHCFHVVSNGKLSSRMLSDILSFVNDGISKQNPAAGCE